MCVRVVVIVVMLLTACHKSCDNMTYDNAGKIMAVIGNRH